MSINVYTNITRLKLPISNNTPTQSVWMFCVTYDTVMTPINCKHLLKAGDASGLVSTSAAIIDVGQCETLTTFICTFSLE